MEATATGETRLPAWYWIVSVIALLWMMIGLASLVMDFLMDEATLMQMSAPQRELYETRPQWIFLVYALAIFSGLLGTLGLLMRQRWSLPVLVVSLLAALVQFGYTLFVMDAIGLIGAAAALPFPLLIIAIGVFLVWFSRHARVQGWHRS